LLRFGSGLVLGILLGAGFMAAASDGEGVARSKISGIEYIEIEVIEKRDGRVPEKVSLSFPVLGIKEIRRIMAEEVERPQPMNK
jgi:hypothetical protein